MTSFDTLQSLNLRLTELTDQLSSSKLSKEELAEFETLSRKLYERAVILNYKSKEESVYGKTTDKKANPVLPFSTESNKQLEVEPVKPIAENDMEAIVEEHNSDIEEEYEAEQEIALETMDEEEIVNEEEVIADTEEVRFDFSGGFDTPEIEEKPKPEINPQKTEESIKVESKIEPEIKKEFVQESIAQKEERMVDHDPRPSLDEVLENKDTAEDKTASYYERFSKAYKAAAGDRLGTSKINSLKGAIGLNDRMLFINELFNGDVNSFNEVINKLDQLENNEVALRQLSEIAANENWNKEDSSVDAFAHLITRRYVD